MTSNKRLYPKLEIAFIKNPKKFYAVPILGFLVKAVMLIPVQIELFFLFFAVSFFFFINAISVLFTNKYLDSAFNFFLGYARLSTKTKLFMLGLTDTYPGFDFSLPEGIVLDIDKPEKPKRIFLIPILGFLIRFFLLIPFFIWSKIIEYATYIGAIFSSFVVIFEGRYPETTYELAYDDIRLSNASFFYLVGISDIYPDFSISKNHLNIKIFLIILSIIFLLISSAHRGTQKKPMQNNIFRGNSYLRNNSIKQQTQLKMQ